MQFYYYFIKEKGYIYIKYLIKLFPKFFEVSSFVYFYDLNNFKQKYMKC